MYKAVVFDVDGTLIDGASVIKDMYRVYKEMTPDTTMVEKDFEICYFLSPDETWEYLGIAQNQEKIDYFRQEVYGEINHRPFKGISEVVQKLKEMGLELGVNTSRGQLGWERAKVQLGDELAMLFDYVVTSDLVENNKPAPDSLFYLLEKMNLKKEEVLYIGDSIFDARCAHAAGCDFALAAWGFHQDVDYQEKYLLHQPEAVLGILTNASDTTDKRK